jgi:DNA-binding FrmR family transcriptional regulator
MDNGVVTYFNLPDLDKEKDTVQLSFLSLEGDTLASFSNREKDKKKLELESGSNKFTWDMRTRGAEKFEGMVLWWASLEGAKVVPGEYQASLSVNGEVTNRNFRVLADPRSEASLDEMKEQFLFVSEVNETIDRAHKSIKKIRKINAQLDAFVKQYENDPEVADLVTQAKELKTSFGDIEKALYQTQNQSNQDPLNFPIRLTNKLGHLNSLVTLDDFAPTAQDIQVKNELTAEISKELDAFDALVSNEIQKFNRSFNESNLNYLFLE